MKDWATIANVPIAVSPADTNPNITSGGLDNGSAYGYPCLSDGKWKYDQRVGQFSYVNRTDFGGDSIVLQEDGAHERVNPSPPIPAALSA